MKNITVGRLGLGGDNRWLDGINHSEKYCMAAFKAWPWWRRFQLSLVRLGIYPPNWGWGLWVYTRRGGKRFDMSWRARP